MASVNKVVLICTLGKDPEVRQTQNGNAICNLSAATSRKYKDAQGEYQEETEWHRISLFGRMAELAGQCLKKGSTAFIEGRLRTRKYKDKDGIEVFKAARESDAKTNSRFEEIARTIADMRVREAQTAGKIDLVAATATQGIAANSAAITCLQNTVAGITKIVVPNSSICPGWGNVTITPASTTTAG